MPSRDISMLRLEIKFGFCTSEATKDKMRPFAATASCQVGLKHDVHQMSCKNVRSRQGTAGVFGATAQCKGWLSVQNLKLDSEDARLHQALDGY